MTRATEGVSKSIGDRMTRPDPAGATAGPATATHHSHPPQLHTTASHLSPTLTHTLTLTLTKGARDHSTAHALV